jgi:uncharacterized SAM-binding protein YcdF (DUF218 family)
VFLAKKIVAAFLMPLPFSLLLAGLGLLLLATTRRQRLGRSLMAGGLLLLLALSTAPVADRLLAPLEDRYPPLDPARARGVEYIVVLGSGHTSDERLPPTSQIDGAALARLVEAIRLQRSLPGSRLLLSGGAVYDPVPNAEVMAHTARAIGVSAKHIFLEAQSRDTEEEAHLVMEIVAGRPFVLVTSASHLPRAMALFEHLGMAPLPAPAHHLVKKAATPSPGDYFPRGRHLRKSEMAVHEYLGLLWARLRGSL